MAEFAVITSIVQIADVGLRLSLRLYTFGQAAGSADSNVLAISKDTGFTSHVVKQLGECLEKDKESQMSSEDAIKTANGVVNECLSVFQEIDQTLEKSMGKLRAVDKSVMRKSIVLAKLKWPFIQPKMEVLRSNLDTLKATMMLLLSVMNYAKKLSERYLRSASYLWAMFS